MRVTAMSRSVLLLGLGHSVTRDAIASSYLLIRYNLVLRLAHLVHHVYFVECAHAKLVIRTISKCRYTLVVKLALTSSSGHH